MGTGVVYKGVWPGMGFDKLMGADGTKRNQRSF